MNFRSAVIIFLVGFLQPATAMDAGENFLPGIKPVLEGLKEFSVVVENLNPSLEKLGVTKKQLQADAELKLRQAGIKVIEAGSPEKADSPYIYISIKSIDYKLGDSSIGVIFSFRVDLREYAFLKRASKVTVVANSWSQNQIATCANDVFAVFTRDILKNIMDQFITDYLAANPKE